MLLKFTGKFYLEVFKWLLDELYFLCEPRCMMYPGTHSKFDIYIYITSQVDEEP